MTHDEIGARLSLIEDRLARVEAQLTLNSNDRAMNARAPQVQQQDPQAPRPDPDWIKFVGDRAFIESNGSYPAHWGAPSQRQIDAFFKGGGNIEGFSAIRIAEFFPMSKMSRAVGFVKEGKKCTLRLVPAAPASSLRSPQADASGSDTHTVDGLTF
jgi:hypothetical protein